MQDIYTTTLCNNTETLTVENKRSEQRDREREQKQRKSLISWNCFLKSEKEKAA